jgi:hypothetical protein
MAAMRIQYLSSEDCKHLNDIDGCWSAILDSKYNITVITKIQDAQTCKSVVVSLESVVHIVIRNHGRGRECTKTWLGPTQLFSGTVERGDGGGGVDEKLTTHAHLMQKLDLCLATLKAPSFYLLHNVSTLNQCRKFSFVTIVCKHFANKITLITDGI